MFDPLDVGRSIGMGDKSPFSPRRPGGLTVLLSGVENTRVWVSSGAFSAFMTTCL